MNGFSESFSRLADLQYFDPKAFQSDKNISKEVCGFVLSLALIFNDVKNINLIIEILEKSKPQGTFEERKDWGEYYGILNYLDRINIGLLHELFKLIKKNKGVLEDIFFKEVIKSIKKDAKRSWQSLVDTSFGKDTGEDKFSKYLILVRNKISFHYDPKIINAGYNYFYENIKKMNKAYISRGNNMVESRFYFADATADSYMKSLYNTGDTESFFKSIRESFQELNNAIFFIVNGFIFKRGFAFRNKK